MYHFTAWLTLIQNIFLFIQGWNLLVLLSRYISKDITEANGNEIEQCISVTSYKGFDGDSPYCNLMEKRVSAMFYWFSTVYYNETAIEIIIFLNVTFEVIHNNMPN